MDYLGRSMKKCKITKNGTEYEFMSHAYQYQTRLGETMKVCVVCGKVRDVDTFSTPEGVEKLQIEAELRGIKEKQGGMPDNVTFKSFQDMMADQDTGQRAHLVATDKVVSRSPKEIVWGTVK